MTLAPDAATITVSETLALLDGPFGPVAAGVAEDRYAFWLGSGISLGRMQGLRDIIARVIEFLRSRSNPADAGCRFGLALNDVLRLASLTAVERGRIDLARPFREWPDSGAITSRLVTNYARVLDVEVQNEAADYLLWDVVGVSQTYADPAIRPDVEHLCLAMLVREGVATDLATANWDDLVERALAEVSEGSPVMVVHVRPEDLRQPAQRAQLYKFHGCAALAASDEANYRPYLIARQSQINSWAAHREHKPIVDRLISLAISKPTLMLGLSAQDANIQALFADAEAAMPWPWPGERPSYVFSEDRLGVDQEALLKNVYRGAYTPASRYEILSQSLIRAYAKPLLIALVLHVIFRKLQHLASMSPGALSSSDRDTLLQGHIAFRNLIASIGDTDRLAFVRALIEHGSRAISSIRDGGLGTAPRPYNPITSGPLQVSLSDPTLASTGIREAAVAVGVLGIGIARGLWSIAKTDLDRPTAGLAQLITTAGVTRLFVVANSYVALSLHQLGCFDGAGDSAVIYSAAIIPPLHRSPRGAPGRTGHIARREVSIASIMAEATSCDELLQRFREELTI